MNKPSAPVGPARHRGTVSELPAAATKAAVARAAPADQIRPDPMHDALLGSRHRWRELVLLGADLAFETDRRGRFALLAPDVVLGWAADQLLGQPAEILLAEPQLGSGFNPFRPGAPARDRRAWLKCSDGSTACLSFAIAPIRDARGRLLGARGIGRDVTEQDDVDEAAAASLRRSEVMDHILWRIRQEVMAPRMMHAALQALGGALGAEGVGVLDDTEQDGPALRYHVGALPAGLAETAREILAAAQTEAVPASGLAVDRRLVLACGCETRFGQRSALVLWREPGGRPWDRDDLTLVTSASGIARVILEHDAIQQEMARQARTDPLTGLLNRRAFFEEVTRRMDRLDREGIPGTLMFIDLDHFKRVNDALGHEAGDETLCIVANLLRAAVRGIDLVARFGGDEFAVWLDGMEELSASERAELLRVEVPAATRHLTGQAGAGSLPDVTLSIGIAARWPGQGESLEALISRADQAMYEVKHAGRGHWRVSRVEAW